MITFSNVNKSFNGKKVLNQITFEIKKGETFCLLGKSGSGKTTLLKMINQLILQDEGLIQLNQKDIRSLKSNELRKGMGYVIQSAGLFPHMKIAENIALPLKLSGQKKSYIKNRINELIVQIGLDNSYLTRYPNSLSGGQQQRIGIARAIANHPEILLMDEPFSALDPVLREQMQNDFLKMEGLKHLTKVIVTHDINEAIKLGDRICLLENGQITFIGDPIKFLSSTNQDVIDYLGKDEKILKIKNIKLDQLNLTPISDTAGNHLEISNQDYVYQIIGSKYNSVKYSIDNQYYSLTEIRKAFFQKLNEVL